MRGCTATRRPGRRKKCFLFGFIQIFWRFFSEDFFFGFLGVSFKIRIFGCGLVKTFGDLSGERAGRRGVDASFFWVFGGFLVVQGWKGWFFGVLLTAKNHETKNH